MEARCRSSSQEAPCLSEEKDALILMPRGSWRTGFSRQRPLWGGPRASLLSLRLPVAHCPLTPFPHSHLVWIPQSPLFVVELAKPQLFNCTDFDSPLILSLLCFFNDALFLIHGGGRKKKEARGGVGGRTCRLFIGRPCLHPRQMGAHVWTLLCAKRHGQQATLFPRENCPSRKGRAGGSSRKLRPVALRYSKQGEQKLPQRKQRMITPGKWEKNQEPSAASGTEEKRTAHIRGGPVVRWDQKELVGFGQREAGGGLA